ncbi:RELT-like protein 2 [Sphaerodactylus townsendi]|uniref:RELT-like protein 2 n=1 Tax=Sphaerodactylus townsendi TaxID=933632 RepID=UPI0020267ED6|nr:RELT-like protein 2 [Sphaerodactylus townsendi]XP_048371635.1 RELT-like protein 2 [Sphaerodactylus townsendi]
MSEQNSTQDGDGEAQPSLSMPFLLVLVFFGMGLVGFLICHVLKKKGYRCRTFRDEFDSDNKEPLAELQNEEDEEMNEDTVEKIVKCIIQNEANVEVLKEMLGEGDTELAVPPPLPIPSLCPHRNSQDGGVPHHHTVHLGSTQAPCIHCSRKKRHTLHRQSRSKEGKSKMHPGETTVFSVGRFHVTHIEKKPASHGSKEKSLPDSSQDLGSGDLDRETREESQNGLVPMDHLQHGRFQEAAGAQSDREPKDACKDESATGESLLNVTTNLDVPKNGLERIKRSKTGSLQEVDLLGTATNNTRDPKFLCPAEMFGSEDLGETERLAKQPHPSENEGVHKAAKDISGNEKIQILQGRSNIDLSGNEINRTQEQQEQSSTASDPGVSV